MIKTQFDDRFREIPLDPIALNLARQRLGKDLPVALVALEGESTELDKIDYYRLLSRASDLDRFELKYAEAVRGFESTSLFWTSIGWDKAAFLCDLKAALCQGYLEEEIAVDAFGSLLKRLKGAEELHIYELFLYQYRGQVFGFQGKNKLAERDFLLGLKISMEGGKKKQIERFRYFSEVLKDI